MARRRLTVQEAAAVLGTSVDAVRSRVRRGSLASEKGEDGRVYVWLGSDEASDKPQVGDEGSSRPLIESKDETIRLLREQLEQANEQDWENRRIIAALTQRIPAIEAPQEPPRTHLINTPPATKGRTFRKHRLSKKARKRHLQCLRSRCDLPPYHL